MDREKYWPIADWHIPSNVPEVFAKDNLAHIAVSFSFRKGRMEVRYGCIMETRAGLFEAGLR